MNFIKCHEFWRSWKQQTFMQMATLAVLTGTFVVVTLFLLIHENLDRILTGWGDSVRMSVFMQDDQNPDQLADIEKSLRAIPSFKEVHFISKSAAAQQFSLQMSNYTPDFLNDPQLGNPLPASFEAQLVDSIPLKSRLNVMKELAEKIKKFPGVDELYYGQGWVENYSAVVKAFVMSSWLLVGVLLVGSLFIVGHSIRHAIYHRQDEIEVLELVGATAQMIRSPYLIEGTLMGFFSGGLSLVLVFLLFSLQSQVINTQLGFLHWNKYIQFLTMGDGFLILMLASLFGGLGAYFSVRKISSGWTASRSQENMN